MKTVSKFWAKLDSPTKVFIAVIAIYIAMYVIADIAEVIAMRIIGV